MLERGNAGILSRSGPALAVIGIHIALVYALVTSMGIVELPKLSAPIEAVFIPEQTPVQPEPQMQIKPQIESTLPMNEPPPDVRFEEPVVPPAQTPIPASQSAISATPASSGPVAQELRTKTRVEPAYPSASRRAGEEGTVRLKVLVDTRGRPQDVEVVKGSGFARLDRAAIEAVKKWRFVAATDGSKAVTAWTQVAITFRLRQ